MIDITGDGPIQIAIQRAFDVLGCEGAVGVVGYLETQPDDAIAVLRLLERIETRRNRLAERNNRTSDSRSSARSTARGCGWMRATDKRGRIEG
jgi:hypothetical protein